MTLLFFVSSVSVPAVKCGSRTRVLRLQEECHDQLRHSRSRRSPAIATMHMS